MTDPRADSLAQAQEEFEALLQFLYLAPVGLVQIGLDGEIVMINPLCAQLLMPLSRDGELANLFTALQGLAPDLALRARRFEPTHGKVCEGLLLPVNAGLPGQREAQVLSLTLLKLDANRLMGVLDDVSVQLRRERELRQSQAWIHTIVNGITDYALLSLDAEGRVADWNPSIGRLTGFTAADVVGQPFARLHPEDDLQRQRAAERLREADASGWNLEEGWLQRADGGRFWGSCLIAPLHAGTDTPPDERGYSLILRDIHDRREAHESLRRSVSCDHLTGLANRRAFFDAAAHELQRCTRLGLPLSLVMIDADHFKAVNDTHGHAAGDAVLRHLAAGLSATFRASDLLARIGGEEFVALLPGTAADDAAAVAARLCRHLSAQSVTVDGVAIGCTVSAGVASLEPGMPGVDALLQRADAAMYAAKAQGRNRVQRWHDGLAARPEATTSR